MRKSIFKTLVVACVAGSLTLSSCIGSFGLSNKVLSWNQQISSKFVNELVFICFWIVPVYELSMLADVLVINSIEFWSGSNPLAQETEVKIIDGKDARYEIMANEDGYVVKNLTDNTVVKFNFDADENSWSVESNGQEQTFMRFIDDTHVEMLAPDGTFEQVELSQAGLYAYQQMAATQMLAQK